MKTIQESFLRVRCDILVCLFLVITTLIVYWDLRSHTFINFDDDLYITDNPHVQSGLTIDSILWTFKHTDPTVRNYWHPLTWLSHMLDYQLYGLTPGMHHSTGLILHVASSLLLFLSFKRMTGSLWRSAVVAALFALHPLNVESVAWTAQRKNVLSTFFWMLTILTYVYYSEKHGIYRYLLTLSVFAMGLLAKPMLVTLPFILLLLDYWPLGRFRFGQLGCHSTGKNNEAIRSIYRETTAFRLVLEKVPFLGLSLVSIYLSSSSVQHLGIVISAESVPMKLRIANALISYVSYIGKFFWPKNLAVFYPYPSTLPVWQVVAASSLLLAVSVLVLRLVLRHPYLAFGWLWYLGTLIPVIGLKQAGLWPAMADRWAYVPLVGLFVIMTWGVPDLLSKWRYSGIGLLLATGALFSALMICTSVQVQHWRNSLTLFEHALDVTTDNWLAHNNLGVALAAQDETQEAIDHFREALRIMPNFVDPYYNLAVALSKQGDAAGAIVHYRQVLRMKPDDLEAHTNIGNALLGQGQIEDAIAHYQEVLRIEPGNVQARHNLEIAMSIHRKSQ